MYYGIPIYWPLPIWDFNNSNELNFGFQLLTTKTKWVIKEHFTLKSLGYIDILKNDPDWFSQEAITKSKHSFIQD